MTARVVLGMGAGVSIGTPNEGLATPLATSFKLLNNKEISMIYSFAAF